MAGWVSHVTLTAIEIKALFKNVEQIGQASGGALTCVLLDRVADNDALPRARLSVRLAVGRHLANCRPNGQRAFEIDRLRQALGEASGLRAEVRQTLWNLARVGPSDEPTLLLIGGTLCFGSASEQSEKSVVIAEGHSGPTVIDVSPEAHEARIADTQAQGLKSLSAPYQLFG